MAQWFRCCATNRKVAGSIPDGVIGIFYEWNHTSFPLHTFMTCSETTFCLLYSYFWVILRRLNFMYRRFGTFCQFHLHRWCEQIDVTRVLGYLYGQRFGSKLPNLYRYKCPNNLVPVILPAYAIYEDGTVPKRRHIKFGGRESPKRKNIAFRTRRMVEIKNLLFTVNHHRTSASNDPQSCAACGRSRTRLR